MTLVELIVVIAIFGLLATVISAAVTVVLRQAPETSARLDTARWEQNLGTWLPADLSSAEWPTDTVEDPDSPDEPVDAIDFDGYEPCAAEMCTWGENVAHFSWQDGGTRVDVSYRYGDPGDASFELRRVECRDGGSCGSITLVRDMPGPVGGQPPITVTFPPVVDGATDESGNPISDTRGRRVTVLVTGMLGNDLLSFTGGGVELIELEPASIQPPEFLQARSGCGGPISLIVDESGSLSDSDAAQVRTGVRSFVETFAGTPTQLQIIGFDSVARVLGASGGAWNHWYDLSDQATIDHLLGSSSPISGLDNNGWTNWEDALYRAFNTETGLSYPALSNPARPPAELVVFFTDGVPTYHRDESQTGAETPEVATGDVPSHFDYDNAGSGTTQFDPLAWYRASWLLRQNATRVIGVGVGTAFGLSVNLDNDTDIPDAVIATNWQAPYGPGSSSSRQYRMLPAEVALGDLIAGNDISNYAGDATDRYVKVEYDGGWDAAAVKDADLLTTTDFSHFGGALESIALAECGGTLTVQTRRLSDGMPLTASVTYEVTGDGRPLVESTTSAVSKTAVFDISTDGSVTSDVLLKPRTLDGSGFSAQTWTCRSRNVEITDPARVSLADPSAGAIGGVNVSVRANEAMSCILFVVPA